MVFVWWQTALIAKSLQYEECIALVLHSIQENLEFGELQKLRQYLSSSAIFLFLPAEMRSLTVAL